MKTLEELIARLKLIPDEIKSVTLEAGDGWEEKVDGLQKEAEKIQKQITTLGTVEEYAAKFADVKVPEKKPLRSLPGDVNEADTKPDGSVKQVHLNKGNYPDPLFVNCIKSILNKDADAMKTLQMNVDPLGGWTLPENLVMELLPVLKEATVFNRLQCRMWPMVDDNITFRKRVGRSSVYWLGEGKDIARTDFRGGRFNLTAKYAAAIVEVSNRLLRSSQGSLVEAEVRKELVEELTLAFEYAYLYGIGAVPSGSDNTGAQPLGLKNVSGVSVFNIGAERDGTTNAATNGGPLTLVDISRARNLLERSNIPMRGTDAFIANPIIKGVLREMVDENGRHYFWESPRNSDNTDTLNGVPIVWTTAIPTNLTTGTSSTTTEMFYGEWNQFYIGTPADMRIDINTQSDSAFNADETHTRVIAKTDCRPAYENAFVRIAGIEVGTA